MSSEPEQDDFQAKTDAFWDWIQQQPGTSISPKIRIADLRAQGQGRGVTAVRDIEQDEELFSIAYSSVLTTENSSLHTIKHKDLKSLEPWAALALTIIYEDDKGQESAWWPYLSILPTTFDTPIFWSSAELEELQTCAVRWKIGKEKADEYFVKNLLPMVQFDPAVFGCHASCFTRPDGVAKLLRMCHRVATLIFAYGFDIDPDLASDQEQVLEDDDVADDDFKKGMVPLADLFNADGDRNNAHLIHNENTMTMIAIKPIQSGEQVFNDFGELPRSDLLRRYGYVTDHYKKWDVVEIPLKLIIEVVGEHSQMSEDQKQQRLDLAGIWNVLDDGFDLSWPEGGQDFDFPRELLLTTQALLLDRESYEREKETKSYPTESSILARSPMAYDILKDVIIQRQKQYRTTVAEDLKLLEDIDLARRYRLAVEVRLGEKELLATALQVVEDMIGKIKTETNGRCREVQTTAAKR